MIFGVVLPRYISPLSLVKIKSKSHLCIYLTNSPAAENFGHQIIKTPIKQNFLAHNKRIVIMEKWHGTQLNKLYKIYWDWLALNLQLVQNT